MKPINVMKKLNESSEYEEIYGEKVDWSDMRKIITALHDICDKAESDGFPYVSSFNKAINSLTDTEELISEFYGDLNETN